MDYPGADCRRFFMEGDLCLTIEEQKYLEECKKKLSQEQVKIVQMAFEYGLNITDIRKFAMPKLRPEQMQQIVYAMLEEIDREVLEQICKGDFDQYQIQEIVSGFSGGLDREEVMSYAVQDLPANRMKKMRTQLLDAKKSVSITDSGMKEYTEKLMQIMDTSLQQFQKNNEKFELLSGLVKDHVFDAKEQEIKDLYENVNNKDTLIHQLQRDIEEKNQLIEDLNKAVAKVAPETAEKEVRGQSNIAQLQSLDTYTEKIPKRKSIFENLLSRNKKKDILDQIAGEGLSPQQLEEIRSAFDSGLPDVQVIRLIRKDLSPEKMRKMKEIMLLIQKRRLSEDVCTR